MKSTLSMRLATIIVAGAAVLALAACSALKLGYQSVPKLAYFWLDGYLDFSDTQEPEVREQVAALQAWHRREELPKIVQLLARMEQLAPGEITPQQACEVVDAARARFAALVDQAEPAATTLALGLHPRQLRHLQRKFRSNDEAFFDDWLVPPPEEQHEKSYRKMLERLEMIYGPLEEPQRAILRQAVDRGLYDAPRVLAERQRRQHDLLQVLRRILQPGITPAQARTLLHGWWMRAQHSPDAGYRAWQEAFVQEGCRIFAAVHASTTPAQRLQAVRRLQTYERDLRELAAQPQ